MQSFSRIFLFIQRSACTASTAEVGQKSLRFAHVGYAAVSQCSCYPLPILCRHFNSFPQQLEMPWGCSSHGILLRKLEMTLENNSLGEAWEAFNNFKGLHGFPSQQLVSRMIISLAYSSNPLWLCKAYNLVLAISKEKPNLLHHDSLTRLALTLVRAQMPVPASTLLRVILEKFKFPSTDIWNTFFCHLVKTQIGSYLASEILIEICEYYICRKSARKNSKQNKLINPSTTMFNLVLNSCLSFGCILKAQHIIEVMSQTGVVADANSIIIIARIYEMLGRRDELKKLQDHIDGVSSVTLNRLYRQFYDSLLSLHFKYNDLDAAADLALKLYQHPKSHQLPRGLLAKHNGLQKLCLFQIGSSNLKMGCKIVVDPEKLNTDFVVDAQSHSGLVLFVDGQLAPSNKAFAKLIHGYVKERKVYKLSCLLISIHKEMDPKQASLSSDVIQACIQVGWLEAAHDILDDLESAAIPIGATTYASLLNAYCKGKMLNESKLLLNQMRKVGFSVNLSSGNAISSCFPKDCDANLLGTRTISTDEKSDLVGFLDREIREADLTYPLIYELNTSILFFCKAKMMEDALKTFKRMQERSIQPTVQTFSHLVNGYSSLNMYRQITILWGEIKRRLRDGVLTADRDLFECLLMNFLRGGYFERVMEIVDYMIKHNMYTDKWKYRREFLKFHRGLYRNLKASDATTDAQHKRIEHVRAFRKWVGSDQKL